MISQVIGASFITAGKGVRSNSGIKIAAKTEHRNYSNVPVQDMLLAYQGLYGIKTAKSVTFGKSLAKVFNELNKQMITCRDINKGRNGEEVGHRIAVSELIDNIKEELPNTFDAIKTNIEVNRVKQKPNENGEILPDKITEARTQIKKMPTGILYEMAVRVPRDADKLPEARPDITQLIQIKENNNKDKKTYVLNTKGNLMSVMEDGDNVLLTNTGKIFEKSGGIEITALKKGNNFTPFITAPQEVIKRKPEESIGEGTEIVIGMEDGRFVPEIIDSIKTFINKIDSEEIVLPRFEAAENAKNIQLSMLAGGFGSRAEYTNASSGGIMHGEINGAQSTKGAFRTATGLTPMETTFISLHKAGLLDCSKGKLNIGGKIKFYLNKSGINKGNGGFTFDLYNKMDREGRKYLAIFPNDSMSRMPEATKKMAELMNSGTAAVAMIAKKVKAEDAIGNLGIMKLGKDGEILEFAEKPSPIPQGYEKDGMCLANTFQFAVSKEAFAALSVIEKYLPSGVGKESRDWSKTYTPILMALSQFDDLQVIRQKIQGLFKEYGNFEIPDEAVSEAKSLLKNQKIFAVPTDESWADCGTLNALYHTTMQIASNDFHLEDFERKHVLDSINTQTGLVASGPAQKREIEEKYDIDGQVMVVPQAKKVDSKIVDDLIKKGLIVVNEKN